MGRLQIKSGIALWGTFIVEPFIMGNFEILNKITEIKKAGAILRAINHPIRKKILGLLEGKEEICVTDIYIHLRIEQSVASMHLKILRESRLVETERKGKQVIYKPNYNNLIKLEKIISEIVIEIE